MDQLFHLWYLTIQNQFWHIISANEGNFMLFNISFTLIKWPNEINIKYRNCKMHKQKTHNREENKQSMTAHSHLVKNIKHLKDYFR